MKHFQLLLYAIFSLANLARADVPPLRVALGEIDITPKLEGRPVWIAGYSPGRRAEGVHDPLFARAVVLGHGERKMALVSVDLVGLQFPTVQRIRAKLKDFQYVMVSSTHNHEGPDTIGLWGRTALSSGVDEEYLRLVVDRVVQLVRRAEKDLTAAAAFYGTAKDEKLLGDSRRPKVYDGVLRVLTFRRLGRKTAVADTGGKLLGVLVQWNCHPESMGSKNKQITADFPAATVAWLKKRYDAPVAYFTGTVGGLMAPPDNLLKDERGKPLREGDFAFMKAYGEAVGKLAARAVDAAAPIQLAPWRVRAMPVAVPLINPYYHLARSLGVIRRRGRLWQGDFAKLGPIVDAGRKGQTLAVETEVAYLRLGQLHVACIPGEIYPELVYGKYQDPVDPGADFAQAPLETPVMKILPGEKTLLFGLANDEIGYLIPKRQWDQKPPFAYGRKKSQYGEINSVGPDAAPIVIKALQRCVQESKK